MTDLQLHLHNLSAGYDRTRTIVHPFDATLRSGQLVCLIGPNGAGKSTLLRTIAGMQKPLSGRVLLGQDDLHRINAAERAKRLSIVLTQKMEVGLFNAYGLVAMGRHPYTAWTGQLAAHDHAIIRHALALVGAEDLANRPFNTLSDGERQKIMIARALAQEPDLLILDEPTAFLDLPRRIECMVLLRDLARQSGRIILASTHDLDLATRYADHLWLLPYNGHLQSGQPEALVTNGDLEAAFRSHNIRFGIENGAFKADLVRT